MDPSSVLKVVGQVAGIGGIGLGVLLLIFREVVRKNIFPNLGQIQAYRIIRMIVMYTFLIAAFGIVAWAYVQVGGKSTETRVVFPRQSPEAGIIDHLQLIDAARYKEAWDAMSSEAHRRFQFDFVVKAFQSVRGPLGKPVNRQLVGVNMVQELPDKTRGAFATASYATKFENAQRRYLEMVTMIDEGGEWKVLFSQLNICADNICGQDEAARR